MTEVESRKEVDDRVKFWRAQIENAGKREATWRKRAWRVVERYRDEKTRKGRRFNILWANTETLKPAVYSQTPRPDVRRRFLDKDPVGRQASEILERALSFSLDDYDFDGGMEQVRDDMLLPGRGETRVVYEAEFVRRTPERITETDEETGDEQVFFMLDGLSVEPEFDGETPFIEEKVGEQVRSEYVFWDDLRIGPARVWEDVPWIAFRHRFSRDRLKAQFKDKGERIPLNATIRVGEDKEPEDAPEESFKRAVLWEIWDKSSLKPKSRIWIAEGFDEVVEEESDPLSLSGFFPVPEPLYGIRTTDSLVPIPEYTIYQDQAIELDAVTDRIDRLMKQLKAAGLYDAAVDAMRNLADAKDGDLIGIDTATALREKGGLAGAIFFWPIENIAKVVSGLLAHREQLKQEIFEITGISDIIRGSTAPRETASAQRLKAGFGNLRMTPRQKPMQKFVRDVIRLKAELMAEHFDQETFQAMTGLEMPTEQQRATAQQLISMAGQAGQPVPDLAQMVAKSPTWDEVMTLLRSDRLRGFRIDIETDSTVLPDEQLQKQESTQFLTALTQYLDAALKIAQAVPQTAPLLMELLKFAARSFKISRTLEDTIDLTAEQLTQLAKQPRPDPAAAEAQAQARQAEAELALKAQKLQAETSLEAQEQVIDAQLEIRQQDIDAALKRREQDMAPSQ